MDTANLSGGTYPINMIAIADDGTIYVSNLSAPQFTTGSTFKVYRYADEQAAPELVFDDALGDNRYGDALAAIGSGNNKYIYSSGQGNEKMVALRDDGSSSLIKVAEVTLPQAGNARHGIGPVTPGGNVWVNGADTGAPPPSLLTKDGVLISVIPDSLASAGGTSFIGNLKLGTYNILTLVNGFSGTIRSVEYSEDEIGNIAYGYFGENSDSTLLFHPTGQIGNANASGTISYDSKRNALVTVIGQNSVSSVSFEGMLKTSTPRDSNLVINIDGVNDFFPTDHVGTSNGRDMFLTWSAGKFFVGITGQTLVDPSETNFMYVAFDLDPAGGQGSSTPPEVSGGVIALPFLADVVFAIEPWKEPEFMLGTIYKWSGSAWTSTLFDGNLASEGALAFADTGNGKLAEFSAIMNEPGIGTDYTDLAVMAYVAEKEASGAVLSAFPTDNPTQTGAAFTHYFYMESLADGLFPTNTDHVQIKSDPSAIDRNFTGVIESFELEQNYPNPFNPVTTITYRVPVASQIDLQVYDITGRLVKTLVNRPQKAAGKHNVSFDASTLSSGIYFYQLQADGKQIQTRKMILIK